MGDNHVVAGAIPAIQTSRFTTVLETGRDSAKIDGGGATPPGGALASITFVRTSVRAAVWCDNRSSHLEP